MSDSPCQAKWIDEDDLTAECECAAGLDDAVKTQIVTAASQIMYVLLGRSLTGQCTATVRPVSETCHTGIPVLDGPVFSHYVDAIPLQWPVVAITNVKIDGETLDPTEYDVMDEYLLVKIDNGNGSCWPASNNLAKPSTEVGTWEITYTFGYAITEDVKLGVQEIACDFAKAIAGRSTALPANTVSVSRGGVNLNLQRAVDAVKESGSTLPQVAKLLSLYNPDDARMPPMVWSPEIGTTLHSF